MSRRRCPRMARMAETQHFQPTRVVSSMWKASRVNCDPEIGLVGSEDRCPNCRQWHLRPGYCQALDPNYRGAKPAVTDNPGWAESTGGDTRFRHSAPPDDGPVTAIPPAADTAVTATEPVTDNSGAVTGSVVSASGVCVECGVGIVSARSDARFCSARCRVRHGRRLLGESG